MANVNWTEEEDSWLKLRPGRYLAEVGTKTEERNSQKSGHPFFNVPLLAVAYGGDTFLCYDIIMLDGPGRGIGQKKLEALGFDKGVPSIEPHDLIGRRVYVEVGEKEYKGKVSLKVDIAASEWCGYWPEDKCPEDVIEPSDSEAINTGLDLDLDPDDDTPF